MSILTPQVEKSQLEEWFDNFVSTLRSHQVQLETKTASDELTSFYHTLMGANADSLAFSNKNTSQKYFVGKIIFEFLTSLQRNLPIKLAFDFNDSTILIWAEINDDDEQMENTLIMTEAKINAKYHQFGFDVKSTIVEQGDQLSIPNHYQIYKA